MIASAYDTLSPPTSALGGVNDTALVVASSTSPHITRPPPYSKEAFTWQAAYDTGIFCNADPSVCPAGTTCVYFDENPNQDTVSYDSVLRALYPLVHTLILDTWSAVMYKVGAWPACPHVYI